VFLQTGLSEFNEAETRAFVFNAAGSEPTIRLEWATVNGNGGAITATLEQGIDQLPQQPSL
jgi:hypothetical protein